MNAELKQAVERLEGWVSKSPNPFLTITKDIQTLLKAVREMGEALKPFADADRPNCDLDEIACQRGVASELSIITSRDFRRAAIAISQSGKEGGGI